MSILILRTPRRRENRAGLPVTPTYSWVREPVHPCGPTACRSLHRRTYDSLDLGRSLFEQTNFRDGVRQPDPGLVEHHDATERGELLKEGLEFGHGPEQLDVADHRPDEDELDRPVAEHLIRQAEIAALGVRRFRHGISVLLSSSYDWPLPAGYFHLVITQASG